jgi:hypothetical protein
MAGTSSSIGLIDINPINQKYRLFLQLVQSRLVIASGVTVLKGQSLHFNGYLQPGAVVHGTVFSKNQLDHAPWAEDAHVKIELYDGPTLLHIPALRANLVSWAGASEENHATRPHDVDPSQDWSVQRGSKHPFTFELGLKGEYGAPRDLDGMVPQLYATWINGLTPGRYYVHASIRGYAQSAADGSAFLEYYFDVKPNECAEELTLTVNLR